MMGFEISEELLEKAAKIALAMGNSEEAVEIPNSGGMVLVKGKSRAFADRLGLSSIFKIPVELKTIDGGLEKMKTFFVCTR